MRENRLSGLEGGVADNGHPYPYRGRWRHPALSSPACPLTSAVP